MLDWEYFTSQYLNGNVEPVKQTLLQCLGEGKERYDKEAILNFFENIDCKK